MKRTALLISLVFLLSGCGGIRVSEEKTEEETEFYKINVTTACVSGLTDEVFQEEINNKLAKDNEALTASFKERISKEDNALDELNVQPFVFRGKCTVSIINDIYEYNGGGHGILSRPDVTIDISQNRLLELEDLFIDDKWRGFLNSKLSELVEADSEKYSVLWEKPVIMDGQSFYIDGTNLVIYYPPYELSYYARGFVDFKVPLSQLQGYIKPMYSGGE